MQWWKNCKLGLHGGKNESILTLVLLTTTRLKSICHWIIHSFIQEIPEVKEVFMKWDTDSFIEFYFVQINIYF